MYEQRLPYRIVILAALVLTAGGVAAQQKANKGKARAKAAVPTNDADARNRPTGKAAAPRDPELAKYGIYEQSAPRPPAAEPVATGLPLELRPGDHIGFIGNTLFERMQLFGQVETLLHQRFPKHHLVVRDLSWSADEITLQPRPAK